MSIFDDILKGVASIFPGGSLVEGALSVLKSAGILSNPEAEEKATEALMQYQLQVQALALEQAKLELQQQQVDADDRASAREREMAVKDSTPRTLAYIVLGGFIVSVVALLYGALTGAVGLKDATIAGLVGTVVGYISAKAEQVVSYYFGSSSGSAKKSASIDEIVKRIGASGAPTSAP